MIEVRPVQTRQDQNEFLRLPYKIYAGDKNWIAPLWIEQKRALFSPRHPFQRHGKIQAFLATKKGQSIGRVAAIVNNAHNDFHHDRLGFFGFFECVCDHSASKALFHQASQWLANEGKTFVRGPVNPSTNEVTGTLIDGFDGPPAFLMPYNPTYYDELFMENGFTKAKDLYALFLDRKEIPERLTRSKDKILKRYNVEIQECDRSNWNQDVDAIFRLYNECWNENWGFVPMTREEASLMAKELRFVMDPKLVLFLQKRETKERIGFILALPDINQAIAKTNGYLFPLGLIRFLREKRRIRKIRVLAFAIKKEWREKGLDSLLYLQIYRNGLERGYQEGEFSWILEDNLSMINPIQKLGAKVYRKYRIYEKEMKL